MNLHKKLVEIRYHYLRDVPRKVDELFKHWDVFHKNWDQKYGQNMIRDVRAIRGGAALLQLPELTETAEPWHNFLKTVDSISNLSGEGIQYCEQNIDCFKKIGDHIKGLSDEELLEWAADNLPELPNNPDAHHETGTIYILDDDQEAAEAIAEAFREEEMDAKCFSAFIDFYMAFQEERPAGIIISSFTEADDDTWEHMDNFKKVPESGLPILMLHDMRGSLTDDDTLRDLGVVEVIKKPASPELILNDMQEILEGQHVSFGLKVLVMESDPQLTDFFRLVFRAIDLPCILSDNYRDGIRKCEESLPDLVLLDLDQPGIDPVQATGGFRKDPSWYNVPFLFLSSDHDGDMGKLKGFLKPYDGFLDTVVSPADLGKVIEELSGAAPGNP